MPTNSIHCKSTSGIDKQEVHLFPNKSQEDMPASSAGSTSPAMLEANCDTTLHVKSVTKLQHIWWAKWANPGKSADRTKCRCEPCWTYRDTIGKMCSYRGKIPGICTESGIVFRAQVFTDHALSQLDKEAVKAYIEN
jgi:hypothetical protein